MSEKYAVLLTTPESYDPIAVAKVLATLQGVHMQDVIGTVRSCGGFLLENAEEGAARDLGSKLNQAGLSVRVLAQSRVSSLPAPQTASAINLQADGYIAVVESSRLSISGDRVILISAGVFNQTSLKNVEVKTGPTTGQKVASFAIMMSIGLPINLGGKEKTTHRTVENTESFLYADVILNNPFERVRIDAQKINYSFLKEKMVYSLPANFVVLIKELAALSPRATLNRGAGFIKRNGTLSDVEYGSLEEMDRESRWLLTLSDGAGQGVVVTKTE